MKDWGVLAYSLHRNPDDPNTLMLYYQFPDMNTLKAYVAFVEALPGEMKTFTRCQEPWNGGWARTCQGIAVSLNLLQE